MLGFALAILGGHFLIIAAAVWVLDRVAGFHVTARERRNYKLLLPLLLAWSVLLALIGPLPLPVTLAINLAAITVWVWAWRSGRFSIERMPEDVRGEVIHSGYDC